jgi:hypothetical protein
VPFYRPGVGGRQLRSLPAVEFQCRSVSICERNGEEEWMGQLVP